VRNDDQKATAPACMRRMTKRLSQFQTIAMANPAPNYLKSSGFSEGSLVMPRIIH